MSLYLVTASPEYSDDLDLLVVAQSSADAVTLWREFALENEWIEPGEYERDILELAPVSKDVARIFEIQETGYNGIIGWDSLSTGGCAKRVGFIPRY